MEGDPEKNEISDQSLHISIHALRVEGDVVGYVLLLVFSLFLSTPSVWRATVFTRLFVPIGQISIHALRVEGDRSAGVFFFFAE